MLNLICRKLADLASLRLQHRFIRDATIHFYMVPEDVIEDAYEAIEIARTSRTLSEDHRAAVAAFAEIFSFQHADLKAPDFFDKDPQWIQLRDAAAACLLRLGFDLAEYENKEIAICDEKPPTGT